MRSVLVLLLVLVAPVASADADNNLFSGGFENRSLSEWSSTSGGFSMCWYDVGEPGELPVLCTYPEVAVSATWLSIPLAQDHAGVFILLNVEVSFLWLRASEGIWTEWGEVSGILLAAGTYALWTEEVTAGARARRQAPRLIWVLSPL